MNNENDFITQILSEPDGFNQTLMKMPDELSNAMWGQVRLFLEDMIGYKELEMMYACAIKAVRTKFEVLNTEFNIRYRRNPINYIATRLKTSSSILEKILRKNLPVSLHNIEQYIHDIAGVRVICSYMDDVYFLADALAKQNDITVLNVKDYIKTPKPNGYRSLHLIVELPVFFAKQEKIMKAEIQIRTTAMDYWATLEHQIKYKKDIPEQEQVISQLKQCADTLAETDKKMLELRNQIENATETLDKDAILLEKLNNLDKPIL